MKKRIGIGIIAIVLGLLLTIPILRIYVRLNNSSPIQNIIVFGGISLFIYGLLTYLFIGWNELEKKIICIGYFGVVAILLLGRVSSGMYFNFDAIGINPFAFIRDLQSGEMYFIQLVLLNIVLFMPAPMLLQYFVSDKGKSFLYCFIFGFIMEVLQSILGRGFFDLSDITLYSIGILIGLLLIKPFNKLERIFTTKEKSYGN